MERCIRLYHLREILGNIPTPTFGQCFVLYNTYILRIGKVCVSTTWSFDVVHNTWPAYW